MTLKVTKLGMRFGSNLLFRDLSLGLNDGELLVVVGANGLGKTTLLKILAGLIPPSAGTISLSIDGKEIPNNDRMRHIGLVSSEVKMYANLSARENLRFLACARLGRSCATRIDGLLNRVGLLHRADERVYVFSSGMEQRLRLAAALLFEPKLLLLDEPMVNLDEEGRELVGDVITSATRQGSAAILATNIPEVASLATNRLDLMPFTNSGALELDAATAGPA